MFKLRDYQEKTVEAIRADWAKGEYAVLITVATGGGKTAIFCGLIEAIAQASRTRGSWCWRTARN